MRRLAVLVPVLLIVGCGGTTQNTAAPTKSPKASKPAKPSLKFDNENVDLLMHSANAYKGASVSLVGQVFNIDRSDGSLAVQMWTDDDQDNQVIAVLPDTSMKVKSEDYLKITGTVHDLWEGTTALGAEIEVPRIVADSAAITDATAMHPAIARLPTQAQMLGDVRYKVRVEFAEDQTRLYVSAQNDGYDDANVDSDPSVVSNGRQIEQDDNDGDLSYELSPSAHTSGVLIYPALRKSGLMIRFSGYDSDYNEAFAEFRWGASHRAAVDAGADETSAPSQATTACDTNIRVGASASCTFAQNVFYSYYESGQESPFEAYSPTTGDSYTVTCSSEDGTVSCSTPTGAYIEFSQASIDSYDERQAESYAASHDVG
jgi:hypothetical protein